VLQRTVRSISDLNDIVNSINEMFEISTEASIASTNAMYESDRSYGGEAALPKDYMLKEWSMWFTLLEYIYDRNRRSQNVIAVRK
jgi:hypothetical protein